MYPKALIWVHSLTITYPKTAFRVHIVYTCTLFSNFGTYYDFTDSILSTSGTTLP